MFVFTRIAVDPIKQEKVEQADKPRGGKTPTPAKVEKQHAQKWDPPSRRKLGGGIGNGCGQASFSFRKPVANRLGVSWKGRGLTHAQKKTRRDKATHPGRACRRKACH